MRRKKDINYLTLTIFGIFSATDAIHSRRGIEYQKRLSKHGTGGLIIMATVKCAYGKRGRRTREWFDGEKDRIYCYGRIDLSTDELIDVCKKCRDCVIHAQDDFDEWLRNRRVSE